MAGYFQKRGKAALRGRIEAVAAADQSQPFLSINGNVCFSRKLPGGFCDRDPNPLMTATG